MNQESETDPRADFDAAIREVASVFRRYRLDYHQTAYVVRQARRRLQIKMEAPHHRLPRNLTEVEREAFFGVIRRAGVPEHSLLFELLYVTGVRVAELTAIRPADVDLNALTIRINQGKGDKDRVVPIPERLRLPLQLHLRVKAAGAHVFESRQRTCMSTRRVQQLATMYGEQAGIERMHPHRLRHSLLTDLTRAGLTDAQIQLISGHASKSSLEVYQSLSLADVQQDYQEAMRQGQPSRRR